MFYGQGLLRLLKSVVYFSHLQHTSLWMGQISSTPQPHVASGPLKGQLKPGTQKSRNLESRWLCWVCLSLIFTTFPLFKMCLVFRCIVNLKTHFKDKNKTIISLNARIDFKMWANMRIFSIFMQRTKHTMS